MTVGRNARQVFFPFTHSDNQLFLGYVLRNTKFVIISVYKPNEGETERKLEAFNGEVKPQSLCLGLELEILGQI